MNLEQLMAYFKSSEALMANVTNWSETPAREAAYADVPPRLDGRLAGALAERGVRRLYTHQASAVNAALDGEDIVVVTPTASGKTLCYNLPVLDAMLKDDSARAMLLFPTKALSHDQASELDGLIKLTGAPIRSYTYDGDTPQSARKAIRQAGNIIVSNPDMLHGAILPNHTKWTRLFESLRYIVIDELHHYGGVFGSHLANVLRRLLRICAFYGSSPQFICCSATIANPYELAFRVTGREARVIDNNGAPAGKKYLVFYNPPVVDRNLGIRKSSLLESRQLATQLLKNGISTIVFTRSRLNVEVLTKYLKEALDERLMPGSKAGKNAGSRVRGYRGGYLPTLRREIERGLRDGSVLGVVSTNALELGIDVGSLEACVICGYPGTIASMWQQAGRAGRRHGASAVFLIASGSPLDQYIVKNPEYFFGQTPEHGLINPDNFVILYNHIKCAAYELPFADGESFGVRTTADILEHMEEARILRHVRDRWHWMADVFPAADISLRSASNENFIIVDISETDPVVIGEMDRFSAPMLLHEEAIYLHEAQQYQVERLDFDEKKAYVRKVDVDYYTDANMSVDIAVLHVAREKIEGHVKKGSGDIRTTAIVTLFKKIKLNTHENIGSGPVNLPELEMHTTAYWVELPIFGGAGAASGPNGGAAGAGAPNSGAASGAYGAAAGAPGAGATQIGAANVGAGAAAGERAQAGGAVNSGMAQAGGGAAQFGGNTTQSYGGAPQPHGNAMQPFGSAQVGGATQPYGGAPQPYGNAPQQFGDAAQPFGVAALQGGSPTQPYGNAPQPFGVAARPSPAAGTENSARLQDALIGLSNVLANAAPLYLMCGRNDIRVIYQTRSPFTKNPTVFIYDNYPGGVGFSDKLYELHGELFETALKIIGECSCSGGCPSCVGPAEEFSGKGNPRRDTYAIVRYILGQTPELPF
ncbi:MAG: DEAD/DEAH box helicase [Clostridiales bacterium]|jgi:DEAD/DEAH box helicase domain-containing protein|nr:DEAD/DEAH box helicase [Clostridiales bacterium]